MEPEIPERPLTDEQRARRRAELLAAVEAPSSRARWVVPVAAAAAVATVGLATWLGLGLAGGADERDGAGAAGSPAGRRSTATDVPTPSETPTSAEPGCTPLDPYATEPLERGLPWEDPEVAPLLATAREVLVDHLDPSDTHLDPEPTNLQSSGSVGCGFSSLGTKLGWSVAGEGGLGVVQIELNRGPRSGQIRLYHQNWRAAPVRLPGVEEARVAEHGDGMAVLVTRTDGLTVAIDADSLFGNNSAEAISGFGFTVEDLLAAAADPRLAMPER